MNWTAMNALLDDRLEDSQGEFGDALRLRTINAEQITLCSLIPQELRKDYLTEITVIKDNLSLTSGKVLMTAAVLGKEALFGLKGIVSVKDHSGKYCDKMNLFSSDVIDNPYLSPTHNQPGYDVFQNYIYVLPLTITAIDVFHLKVPEDISGSVNCELNSALHPILIDLTAAAILRDTERAEKSKQLIEEAILKISKLN